MPDNRYNLTLDECERQCVLMGLERVRAERPGWEGWLTPIEHQLGGRVEDFQPVVSGPVALNREILSAHRKLHPDLRGEGCEECSLLRESYGEQ